MTDPTLTLALADGIGRGITIGRAQVLAALRHVVELTARPICGTPRPDFVQLITTVEHIVAQDWPLDKVVIREEYREPNEVTTGGWVWAVYRDDDAMMTELLMRDFRGMMQR